jgi:Uma2 family endonuclease
MSTVEGPKAGAVIPPLVEGQRLDQPTFHARYEAMPPGTRAELIDGVVHMPSPVGSKHGEAHVPIIVWLAMYARRTPGTTVLDNATAILGWKSEVQPDAQLRLEPESGGRTRIERGFVTGPPELVVEVAHSTRYVDLGPKLDEYERAGVREYVVRTIQPAEVLWHAVVDGRLREVAPDADGLLRSRGFPGLWLDPKAFLSGDLDALLATLDLGLASEEHAAFVLDLERRGQST